MSNQSPQEYITIPVLLEAMKLEEDNLPAVAQWCKGKVKGGSISFPKIRDRSKPIRNGDTSSYAIIGEYIEKTSRGFKVVRPEEFERTRRPATRRSPNQ